MIFYAQSVDIHPIRVEMVGQRMSSAVGTQGLLLQRGSPKWRQRIFAVVMQVILSEACARCADGGWRCVGDVRPAVLFMVHVICMLRPPTCCALVLISHRWGSSVPKVLERLLSPESLGMAEAHLVPTDGYSNAVLLVQRIRGTSA
ncbi:MAG: hypothetical protein RMK18_06010 [Armatimonadota bacterium]|nr:hypothetical protein [Armatimonadota bacterium]MDW8025403.1 hypothetical protein [Armatimonadota bacterium]